MEFTAFFAGVILGGLIAASIVYAYFSSVNHNLRNELDLAATELEACTKSIEHDRNKLKKYEEAVAKTPEDCVRGDWCRACAFDKWYCIHDRVYYYCGKNDACPNMLKKVVVEK